MDDPRDDSVLPDSVPMRDVMNPVLDGPPMIGEDPAPVGADVREGVRLPEPHQTGDQDLNVFDEEPLDNERPGTQQRGPEEFYIGSPEAPGPGETREQYETPGPGRCEYFEIGTPAQPEVDPLGDSPPISRAIPVDFNTPPSSFDMTQRDVTISGIGRLPDVPNTLDAADWDQIQVSGPDLSRERRRGRPPAENSQRESSRSQERRESSRSESPAPKAKAKAKAKAKPKAKAKALPRGHDSDDSHEEVQMPHPAPPKRTKKTKRKTKHNRFVRFDHSIPENADSRQEWSDVHLVTEDGETIEVEDYGIELEKALLACLDRMEAEWDEFELEESEAFGKPSQTEILKERFPEWIKEEDSGPPGRLTSIPEESMPDPGGAIANAVSSVFERVAEAEEADGSFEVSEATVASCRKDPWSLFGRRMLEHDHALDLNEEANMHFYVTFANWLRDCLPDCLDSQGINQEAVRNEFIDRQKEFWAQLSLLDLSHAQAFAYKSQLITEDTPMRELRKDEIKDYSELVEAAEQVEFDSFAENETFEIVTFKPGMKVISSRELIQWKIPRKKVKCRVVLRGFEDVRQNIDTDSPTLRPESFKLLLQYSADHDLEMFKIDLKTAFLLGDKYDPEDRVYWSPPVRFRKYWGMGDDEVCVALKSIYGLNDAPRRWFEKLSKTLMDDKIMKSYGLQAFSRHWLDACLYQVFPDTPAEPSGAVGRKLLENKRVSADIPRFGDLAYSSNRFSIDYDRKPTIALGMHVDDLLAVGSADDLKKLAHMLKEEFTVGSLEWNDFKYRGLDIWRTRTSRGGRETRISMKEYIQREVSVPKWHADVGERCTQRIKNLVLDKHDQKIYRSLNGKLQWCTTQLRPDVAVRVSQAATKYGKATGADAVTLNSIVKELRSRDLTMVYSPLDGVPLSVHTFGPTRKLKSIVDASFKHKNEPDLKARGGYFMTLASSNNRNPKTAVLGWSSKKFLRVCKSPTGAEILGISGIIDEMDFMKHIVSSFYGPELEDMGSILTDSGSITTAQDKLTGKANANLHVDLALIKQRVAAKDCRLYHILGEYNAADGLTKVDMKAQQAMLRFLSNFEISESGCKEIDPVYYAMALCAEQQSCKWFMQYYCKYTGKGTVPWEQIDLRSR